MRVLWVINGPTSEIGKKLNLDIKDSMGWLTGILSELRINSNFELSILFPIVGEKRIIVERIDNVTYYSFYQKPLMLSSRIPSTKVGRLSQKHLKEIIDDVNPDLMHIFGSEFEHSLEAAKIYNRPSTTLVHIQGLISVIANHFYAGLPIETLGKFTFSNFLRGNIIEQQKRFSKRGKHEIELLRYVFHVNGRTDWDRVCVKRMNPQVRYHFCNESLRSSFYENFWEISKCKKRVLFISQATYPIKGFHFALEALNDLKKDYPDILLKVAGNNLIDTSGLYNKLRISSYGVYIRSIIKKYDLWSNIEFTGFLTEAEMVKNLLEANVFISASCIENSPNSVAEAMLVGTPVVTSDVGGVRNLFDHGFDGFSYQYDAPYMLAYYVKEILDNDELAIRFSNTAKKHASITHEKNLNTRVLQNIYCSIINQGNEAETLE